MLVLPIQAIVESCFFSSALGHSDLSSIRPTMKKIGKRGNRGYKAQSNAKLLVLIQRQQHEQDDFFSPTQSPRRA
jgi:hypothetical protein